MLKDSGAIDISERVFRFDIAADFSA